MAAPQNRPSLADLYRQLFAQFDAVTAAAKNINSIVIRIASLTGNLDVQKVIDERIAKK